MTYKSLSHTKFAAAAFSFLLFACLTTLSVRAQSNSKTQEPPPPANEEKAEQIIRQAVEALGGNAYLNVRNSVGRGRYSLYKEGQLGPLYTFVDYIIYPNWERTEFRGDDMKSIQTNTGETGWIYDGMLKSLKDMKPNQVADFKFAMRVNVDNFLRGTWRKESAKIAYAGRREAGLAKRNETVRVTYPDGFSVEFEFGAQDHLPAKVLYKRLNEEGAEVKEEDRMLQYLKIDGIMTPFVVDHYREGAQASRINYESVQFNAQIPDSLFTRPENAKAVK